MTRMHVGAIVFGLMSSAWAFCAPPTQEPTVRIMSDDCPEGSAGSRCQYSDAILCHGRGVATYYGTCECLPGWDQTRTAFGWCYGCADGFSPVPGNRPNVTKHCLYGTPTSSPTPLTASPVCSPTVAPTPGPTSTPTPSPTRSPTPAPTPSPSVTVTTAPTPPSPCDPFHGIDLFDKATGYRPGAPLDNVLGISVGSLAECARACLDHGQCKSLTYKLDGGFCTTYGGSGRNGMHGMPRNTAGLPELVAAAEYDYYEIVPCLPACPADYRSRFTFVPNARPKFASAHIANFIAYVPSNVVNECFAACRDTFSCLSFTVVSDIDSDAYGRCQLYSKRHRNPTYQKQSTNKDLYYITEDCAPTCPATSMERFTHVPDKRPINAGGYFVQYDFGGATAAAGAELCADRCRFHGGFACKSFAFMDWVAAGSFGQCRLYSKLYSAAFLSDRPTAKDYYAYEGARCVDGYTLGTTTSAASLA